MSFLRALLNVFRRPAPSPEPYEAEVLFSGWVDLPPLFRQAREAVAPDDEGRITPA